VSGPVDEVDVTPGDMGVSAIEVQEGRSTSIGRLGILRILPAKARRTIGPWCFVDLMSPGAIAEPPPIEIGPHPHIGLATVTWLFGGSALHSDSLGTQQLIEPGQLNLMTAGRGVAHAELGVATAPGPGENGIMGVQMWLAQPEGTRNGSSRFEHLGSFRSPTSVRARRTSSSAGSETRCRRQRWITPRSGWTCGSDPRSRFPRILGSSTGSFPSIGR
jgi:quercetin 2,3-dioxygenase